MAVRQGTARHSSNTIATDKTLFFLDTYKETFSKSSAYHAIKKYTGNARGVKVTKNNGKWIFDEIIN